MEPSTGHFGVDFVWKKADRGYRWIWVDSADLAPDPWEDVGDRRVPVLASAEGTTGYLATRPLKDNPDLFKKFAGTEPTEEGILAFADEHGRLEDRIMFIYYEDESDPETVTGEYVATFDEWVCEIKDMADALNLRELIKKQDKKGLSQLVSIEDGEVYYRRQKPAGRSNGIPIASDVQRRMLPGDLTIPAMLVLKNKVNRKLRINQVTDQLRLNENNALEGFRSPTSLLAAMWMQFYYYVQGLTDFKPCSLCGEWEAMYNPDGTKRHNENWTMHKECAARKRAAEQYKSKKEKAAKAGKKPAKKPAAKKTAVAK